MTNSCPLCNTINNGRSNFAKHLTKHHKDLSLLEKERIVVYTLYGEENVEKVVVEYIDEKYCVFSLPIKIGKYLELLGVKRSSKEERKTKRYKETYLEGLQKVYGTEITNISQVKAVQEKKMQTVLNNYASYEEYLAAHRKFMKIGLSEYNGTERHKQAVLKNQQTCLERYGVKNFGNGEEAKKKSSISRRKIIDSWSVEQRLMSTLKMRQGLAKCQGVSKIEIRVRKAVAELGIEATYNRFLWNFNFDIVFKHFIIEVQGILWHAKPSLYKETDLILGALPVKDIWAKDQKKKHKANTAGYALVEIWEDEINACNDDELVLLVKCKLEEHGYEFPT